MKVIVLYRPKSEQEGKALDYAREYKQLKNRDLDLVSLDTVEGDDMAKLYDITQYPAIVAIKEDGQLQKLWQGDNFPMMNELDYYTTG
jgi:hypothetical protein